MIRFNSTTDPDELIDVICDILSALPQGELAALFATGKSELEVRDRIFLGLNKMQPLGQVVTREWKRHDFAILQDGTPHLIIEHKHWIHADAVDPKKLRVGEKSILHALEADIEKLRHSAKEYGQFGAYILMVAFTVDVSRASKERLFHTPIKYASTHLKGIKKFGNAEDLAGVGRSQITDLLIEHGLVKRRPLHVGEYFGFPIEADIYLLRPNA